MMVEKIVDRIILSGKYSIDEREILVYGLSSLIKLVAFYITTLIMGQILGIVIESIIFLLCFSTLRRYTGGVHVDSPLVCYLISCSTTLVGLVVIKLTPVDLLCLITVGLTISAIPVITVIAPVEAVNKPLDTLERTKYRNLGLITLIFQAITIVIFMLLGLWRLALSISIALGLIMCMLMWTQLRKYLIEHHQ